MCGGVGAGARSRRAAAEEIGLPKIKRRGVGGRASWRGWGQEGTRRHAAHAHLLELDQPLQPLSEQTVILLPTAATAAGSRPPLGLFELHLPGRWERRAVCLLARCEAVANLPSFPRREHRERTARYLGVDGASGAVVVARRVRRVEGKRRGRARRFVRDGQGVLERHAEGPAKRFPPRAVGESAAEIGPRREGFVVRGEVALETGFLVTD